MAEGLARRVLPDHHASSAGFLMDGAPATDEAIATMAARGIDISDHVSRVVTVDMVDASDLVLTMTSQHVAEVSVMAPAMWSRVFTLRDFARRMTPRQADEDIAAWLARLNAGRTPRDVLSAASADDIADPIGLPLPAYERTADEIDAVLGQIAFGLRVQR